MTAVSPTFDKTSPEALYTSFVTETQNFYSQYVSRPHIQRRGAASSWTLDERILQAERAAVHDGLLFQRDPTLHHLHQYQNFKDLLVNMQDCVRTEAWRKFTDNINQQTRNGTMWRLIKRVTKRKSCCALHHSPEDYAQQVINELSRLSQVTSLPRYVTSSTG